MYFDPIRTMVNFKNQIYFIQGVFWPKNRQKTYLARNQPISPYFCLKYALDEINSIFKVHHRSYRVKIHRKRYKSHHIS